MSVRKWAYSADKCDGDYCPQDCDYCNKAEQEIDFDDITTDGIIRAQQSSREWMIKIPIERREPIMKWIPCKEKLPEKAGKYLVSVKNGNVYAGTFDQYSKKFQCGALAWMPLPEPYRKEGEADE